MQPGPAVSTRARAALGDISNRGLAGGLALLHEGVHWCGCGALRLLAAQPSFGCSTKLLLSGDAVFARADKSSRSERHY